MRKSRISTVLSLILSAVLLCGCGVKEGPGASVGDSGTAGEALNVGRGENMLSVLQIKNIRIEKPEEGYKVSDVFWEFMDGRLWMFRVEFPEPEDAGTRSWRVCMQVYDSTTQRVERKMLMPEVPGHEECWVSSVGLTDQGEISLKLAERTGEENSFFLIKTDSSGELLEVTDPFPDEKEYPWNADRFSGRRVFHLTDGRTVISRWDEAGQVSVLNWFDGEKAGQEIGRLEDNLSALCLGEEGILYCLTGDSLISWDVEKNLKEEIFRLNENGVVFSADSELFLTGDGDLMLCRMNGGEILAYVLTDEEIVYDAELRLSCVSNLGESRYLSKYAANYAHAAGGLPVVMEKEQEKYQEDYRNRIFAELAAGKGPDILYLSKEDLLLLAEKGVLCDLSDMIPEDIKNVMIPAALELGVIDGKMVGFVPRLEFTSLITSNRIWGDESWSLDEFLEAAESGEDWEIMIYYLGSELSASALLDMLISDVDNTSLLDLEQGVSYFNSDAFVRILELCKKSYQNRNAWIDGEERAEMLKEGRVMAEWRFVTDLSSFSRIMDSYGEDCNFVGYPAEGGSGNYARAEYLAVNANAVHMDEIKKFFTYLLDYDRQFAVDDGCSVRLDVIRDSVLWNPEQGYRMRISDNPDQMLVRELATKPDGTTWLEEYLAFVENCRPEPVMPEPISMIVAEEAAAYFEGDRNAAETADIIHNRVQNYLDENR